MRAENRFESLLKDFKAEKNILYSNEMIIRSMADMIRIFDKEFNEQLKEFKKNKNINITTYSKNKLRHYYYYGENAFAEESYYQNIKILKLDIANSQMIVKEYNNRVIKYGDQKIFNSLILRLEGATNRSSESLFNLEWLKFHEDKAKQNSEFSLLYLNISQTLFEGLDYETDNLLSFLYSKYDELENYRHLIISIEGELYDNFNNIVTWEIISKIGIFLENIREFSEAFHPFKKSERIQELDEYLANKFNRKNIAKDLSNEFYSVISYGYVFEDLYISEDGKSKILISKKVELDNSPLPCPACMSLNARGNSYPSLFVRSYECQNPYCISRSKSGRGKRFDEYSTYRYLRLVEGDKNNKISKEEYSSLRKDVFNTDLKDFIPLLIRNYTFANEKVAVAGKIENFTLLDIDLNNFARKLIHIELDKASYQNKVSFDNLKLVKVLKKISAIDIKVSNNNIDHKEHIIVNDDSSEWLRDFDLRNVASAITSPPYYNARDYSQYGTLIIYLIEMMYINKLIYMKTSDELVYLFNVGDVVSIDNVYVKSNMTKRRLPLGFYSFLINYCIGFKLSQNIIWSKGEVQSRRSSTPNYNSGYIKPVNSYEHILVFNKSGYLNLKTQVEAFSPVIKINSKGVNTKKHTAPYPEELVSLIKPFAINNKYILDPFLGSGTTVIWSKKNGFKSIGIEKNIDYYNLAVENYNQVSIPNIQYSLFKDDEI